jgi:hypothetical protein
MSGAATDTGQPRTSPAVNPWIIAVAVTIATFMEVLDTSIANVALRYIAVGLSAAQAFSVRGNASNRLAYRWPDGSLQVVRGQE